MYKIGSSTDIHKLGYGETLILGGVKIDHDKGLIGHSDADVLTHSIIEALIGAMGLGDIGDHFSDTDNKYKGIDSLKLLQEVKSMLQNQGYEVVNIDSLLIMEAPKLKNLKREMEKNIASTLGISESQVNVKATTGEKLGFIGNQEGIAAQASVLIKEL